MDKRRGRQGSWRAERDLLAHPAQPQAAVWVFAWRGAIFFWLGRRAGCVWAGLAGCPSACWAAAARPGGSSLLRCGAVCGKARAAAVGASVGVSCPPAHPKKRKRKLCRVVRRDVPSAACLPACCPRSGWRLRPEHEPRKPCSLSRCGRASRIPARAREREVPHVSSLGILSASWAFLGISGQLGMAGHCWAFSGQDSGARGGERAREARIARGQAGAPRLLQQMPRLGADLAVLGMSWRGLARM